jgi:hypothetical protein
VRRLKRELNQLDEQAGRAPRFGDRIPEPIPLYFGAKEKRLSAAFGEFRAAVKSAIASAKKTDQLAGSFAVEVLNKRLLSCPYTLANSWYRFKEGIERDELAELAEVQAAKRATLEDLDDDRETEGRLQHAAKTTGAWLKPLVPHLSEEIAKVDRALEQLNLVPPTPTPNSQLPLKMSGGNAY